MARQLLYANRPADALDLIRLARDGSRAVAGPRLRAMLLTREAWALASMGRTATFSRATEEARTELADAGDPGDEPYWIAYSDTAELAGTTGGRHLELARDNPREHAEHAGEEIRRALATRKPGADRSTALDSLGLAETYFLVGDVGTAVTGTHAALDVAERVQSGRVREGMAWLYSYTVRPAASAQVREARARLRGQLAD